MKPTNKTYRKFQELILKSEGKTLEDELEFGCRIIVKSGLIKNSEQTIIDLDLDDTKLTNPEGCIKTIYKTDAGQDFYIEEITEILGQDITLERVLMALGENWFAGKGFKEDSKGIIFRQRKEEFERWPIVLWNLCKPLHEQSEEALLKLIEILK